MKSIFKKISKTDLKKLLPLLITIIIFILLYYFSTQLSNDTVQAIIKKAGVFGPLVFIVLNLLTYIIAPLSGSPLLYASFMFYGTKTIFYLLISELLAMVINFWIARWGGRLLVKKFAGEKAITQIDKLTENYGYKTLFILRFFQGGIHDFVSFAAGLTNMNFKPYILISVLAKIPDTFIRLTLFKNIDNPAIFTLANFVIVFVFSSIFVIYTVVKKKLKK